MKKYQTKFQAKEYYLLNKYPQQLFAVTGGILWRSYLGFILGIILQYIFWFWHKDSIFKYIFLYWGWSIPWGAYWAKFVKPEVEEEHKDTIKRAQQKHKEDKNKPRTYIFFDKKSYFYHQLGDAMMDLIMATSRLWGTYFLSSWFAPYRAPQAVLHKIREYGKVTKKMKERLIEIDKGNF